MWKPDDIIMSLLMNNSRGESVASKLHAEITFTNVEQKLARIKPQALIHNNKIPRLMNTVTLFITAGSENQRIIKWTEMESDGRRRNKTNDSEGRLIIN